MNPFNQSTMSGLSRLALHKRVKLSIINGEITADAKNAAIEELEQRFNYESWHFNGKLGRRYVHIVVLGYVRKGVNRYLAVHFNTGVDVTLNEALRISNGEFREVDDYGRVIRTL